MASVPYYMSRERLEAELDAAFAKNRYNHRPDIKPHWHPYESEEAYQYDRQLAAYLKQEKARYMLPDELKAFMVFYREAFETAKRLGAEQHLLEPGNLKHDHRPSWWPYESEADYLADKELLVLIGFLPEGSIDWTPAHLKERMKPYREAYNAQFEKASQPEPEVKPEPDPEPVSNTPPHIDMALVASTPDPEQNEPEPHKAEQVQPSFLKRFLR